MAAKEIELWAQTILTITPQENGTIREINDETKISGSSDTELQLDTNNISLLKHITSSRKHFVDPAELSKKPYAEVECQTFIQNVTKVHIPLEYVNEATQTFYIGKQCPITNALEGAIAAINKKSIPPLKCGQISQTIITFDGNYLPHIIIHQLFIDTTDKHKDLNFIVSATEDEISKIEAWHSLNHITERAFWISDPEEPIVKTEEAEIQTFIICNSKSGKAFYDQETQTGLTCKSKDSNSELLSDYLETKNLVRSCLEDCLATGVYCRIVVDGILDEVLDKCSQEIHLPFVDNATQTLASCKILDDRDEDIVRKLRLPIVVDPLESSIVLVPLIDEILGAMYIQISKNAVAAAKNIICNLIKKTVLINVSKMEESRKQADKPLDHIFIQRKRKIAQSMRKKPETGTASAQTKIAGFPEAENLEEPLQVPCSVCARESECGWCSGSQQDVNLREEVPILKTQDILLAYRPCYIRTFPADTKVMQPVQVPKKDKKIPNICSKSSVSKTTSSDSSNKSYNSSDSVRRKLDKKTSPSGWSHVDLHPSKMWSSQGSETVCDGSVSEKSTSKSSKSACKLPRKYGSQTSSKSQSDLPPQAATALQILKRAFCTRETCPNKDENAEVDSTFSEGNEDLSTRKRQEKIQEQSAQSTKKCKNDPKVTAPFRTFSFDK